MGFLGCPTSLAPPLPALLGPAQEAPGDSPRGLLQKVPWLWAGVRASEGCCFYHHCQEWEASALQVMQGACGPYPTLQV